MLIIRNPEVVVEGDIGIYGFSPYSATGKTLLLNALFAAKPADVFLATYNNGLFVLLDCDSPKFALFDRADLYRDTRGFQDTVNRVSKTAVTCVDTKGSIGDKNTWADLFIEDLGHMVVDCTCA